MQQTLRTLEMIEKTSEEYREPNEDDHDTDGNENDPLPNP
jgi:hypothetical protein